MIYFSLFFIMYSRLLTQVTGFGDLIKHIYNQNIFILYFHFISLTKQIYIF